jgi:DNA-binding NtrC family response regulator
VNRPHRILIADDQSAVREALRILLVKEGYEVALATSPKEVLETLETTEVALVLLDLNYARDTTSGQEGLDLIAQIKKTEGAPPIVVMTAWATVDLAVAAMRTGARDFFEKPWENSRVLAIVRTQVDFAAAELRGQRLESENQVLRGDAGLIPTQKSALATSGLIAHSPGMRGVVETIQRIAPSDANVLVTGENGTGKGIVARAIHSASQRAEKAFVTVNMGGLNENLFESELFGQMEEPYFWMRSGIFRSPNKPNCCAQSKLASLKGSVPRKPDARASGFCPQQTPIYPVRLKLAGSGEISISGCVQSKFRFRRCETARKTSFR